MGLMGDQIKERMKHDQEMYTSSLTDMASVVILRKLQHAYEGNISPAQKALSQLMEYYRIPQEEEQLIEMNLEEVIQHLCIKGKMMKRNVKLQGNWYKDGSGALLAVNQENSLVALLPYQRGGYYYIDLNSGKKQRIHKNRAHEYSDAYCFYESLPQTSCNKKDVFLFMRKQISLFDCCMFLFVIMISMLIGMFTPSVNAYLFSNVLTTKNHIFLFLCMSVLFSMGIANLFFHMMNTLLCAKMETKIATACEAALMIRLLHLPANFFTKNSAGELTSKMEHVQSLCQVLVSICLSSALTACFSLLYMFQIIQYAPSLGMIACCFFMINGLLIFLHIYAQVHMIRKRLQAENKETDLLYALLSGIQKIKNAGAEKRAFAKWASAYKQHALARYDPMLFIKIMPVLNSLLQFVFLLCMYFIAYRSQIEVSSFIAFQSAYAMMSVAFFTFGNNAQNIALVFVSIELLEPILQCPCEIQDERIMVSKISGGIELNNVSFRYDEHMPYLLNDVSLKIRAGQYVAIVGETGCGKSTFLRMLLGFETPQRGAIYYDGKDMTTLDIASLRKKFGVVLQDGKLFQGNIYSNISICAPTLTMEDAWKVAELVGMREDIEHMPMEMFTLLSEGGGGLSGGQRQRLLIARALAPNPKILMFDEATSALDNMSQKQVSKTLDALKCTRIVIAHRLSTIQHCDRILVLKDGVFVEDGTYEKLIEKQGVFANLVKRQQIQA